MKNMIVKNKVRIFLLGEYGDFDDAAFEVLFDLKKIYTQIELHCILPYKHWENLEWYVKSKIKKGFDRCYYIETHNTFDKYAIIERNKKMIDFCDFAVFYMDENLQTKSGTNIAYRYALSKHKTIFNVFNLLNSLS